MPSQIYVPEATVAGETPKALTVTASLALPWRLAKISGAALSGEVTAIMSSSPVFVGEVDDAGAIVRGVGDISARGLSAWRREVGPLTFADVRLETVLGWIAGACGGQVQVQAKGGQRRHYVLRRGRADQLVREALTAWGDMSPLIELDGSTLYIGKETESPHARAGTQFTARRAVNLLRLVQRGAEGTTLVLPLTPTLRVGHRGTVDHPLLSGDVRVTECEHQFGQRNLTRLEVMPL